MKDIIDNKAGSMDISSFSSVQSVKYHLKSLNKSAVENFSRKEILYTPVNGQLVRNMKAAASVYAQNLKSARLNRHKNMNPFSLGRINTHLNHQSSAASKRLKENALKKSLEKHQRKSGKIQERGVKRKVSKSSVADQKRAKKQH